MGHASPALRALRTEYTEALEFDTEQNAFRRFGDVEAVYFRGDLERGIALGGEVAGRIESIRPVAEIIDECARECLDTLADLAERYPAVSPSAPR